MGDDDSGASLHQPFKCLLDQVFGLGIHGGCSFIHNQDGRVLQDRPCNGQALLLTAGQFDSSFTD